MVAINHFVTDTDNEVKVIQEHCSKMGIKISLCTHWSNGGEGTKDLAKNVVASNITDKCLIQLAYAIGVSKPLSIYVDLFDNDE